MISMKRSGARNLDDPINTSAGAVPIDSTIDAMDTTFTDGKFEFMFLDMGQGDCTLVKCPDGRLGMIDCGSKGYGPKGNSGMSSKVRKGIRDQISAWTGTDNKNKIDFLILTHSDNDHNNLIIGILGNTKSSSEEPGFTISKIYFSNGPNATGPTSIYALEEQYKPWGIPSTVRPLSNYAQKLSAAVFSKQWGTQKVIEVVINNEEHCYYEYDVDKTDKDIAVGGNKSQFGTKVNCDEIIDEDGNGIEAYELIVANGNSANCGEWKISLVAGNVLKLQSIQAERTRPTARDEAPLKKPKLSDDESTTELTVNDDIIADDEVPGMIVYPSYGEDSGLVNAASICTCISYKNPNLAPARDEVILTMGDATNLTFDFLYQTNYTDDYCALSNIPHHGSNADCNGLNGDEEVIDDTHSFIGSNLRPKSSVVSVRPFSTSTYHLPKKSAIDKYLQTAETDTNAPHSLDAWTKVAGNGGDNMVNNIYEAMIDPTSLPVYAFDKLEDGWYLLQNFETLDIPEDGLAYFLNLNKGAMLKRYRTDKKVLNPGINNDSDNTLFKFITRTFPEAPETAE